MSKLNRFKQETRQLDIDELLTQIEVEETGNGHGLVDEVCFHVDYPDFRCKVLRVDDGRAYVKVLDGWRGPSLPREAVPVPTAKLELSS